MVAVKLDFFLKEKLGLLSCLECGEILMTKAGLGYADIELLREKFWQLHKECEK
jgi:hypothetical protein